MLVIAGSIVGGIVYLIGVFNVADDVMENGKSLEEYRKQYGKDLGLLLCTGYRSLMIGVWPVMLFTTFGFGLVRDTLRLITGKGPKEIKKSDS